MMGCQRMSDKGWFTARSHSVLHGCYRSRLQDSGHKQHHVQATGDHPPIEFLIVQAAAIPRVRFTRPKPGVKQIPMTRNPSKFDFCTVSEMTLLSKR